MEGGRGGEALFGCVLLLLLLGGVCSLAVSGLGDSWPCQLSGPPPVEHDQGEGGHPAGDTPPPHGITGAGESCRMGVEVVVVVVLFGLALVDDVDDDAGTAPVLLPAPAPRVWPQRNSPTSRLLQRIASLSGVVCG